MASNADGGHSIAATRSLTCLLTLLGGWPPADLRGGSQVPGGKDATTRHPPGCLQRRQQAGTRLRPNRQLLLSGCPAGSPHKALGHHHRAAPGLEIIRGGALQNPELGS